MYIIMMLVYLLEVHFSTLNYELAEICNFRHSSMYQDVVDIRLCSTNTLCIKQKHVVGIQEFRVLVYRVSGQQITRGNL